MAKPTDVVKYCMLEYPGIFPDVGSVLHHLFLVNGNGYSWDKGELVDHCSRVDVTKVDFKKIAAAEIRKMKKGYEGIRFGEHFFPSDDAMNLRTDKEIYDYKFTVKNIDRIASLSNINRASYTGELYQLCGRTDGSSEYPNVYQKLFTVPDDVTNEWLVVAYKFAENMQVTLNQKMIGRAENADLAVYKEEIDSVAQKLDDMMVARGMRASKSQRAAVAKRVATEY